MRRGIAARLALTIASALVWLSQGVPGFSDVVPLSPWVSNCQKPLTDDGVVWYSRSYDEEPFPENPCGFWPVHFHVFRGGSAIPISQPNTWQHQFSLRGVDGDQLVWVHLYWASCYASAVSRIETWRAGVTQSIVELGYGALESGPLISETCVAWSERSPDGTLSVRLWQDGEVRELWAAPSGYTRVDIRGFKHGLLVWVALGRWDGWWSVPPLLMAYDGKAVTTISGTDWLFWEPYGGVATDGRWVVWARTHEAWPAPNYLELWAWDGETSFRLSDDLYDVNVEVTVDNGTIAWCGHRVTTPPTESTELFVWKDGVVHQITSDSYGDRTPLVDAPRIAWRRDLDAPSGWDISHRYEVMSLLGDSIVVLSPEGGWELSDFRDGVLAGVQWDYDDDPATPTLYRAVRFTLDGEVVPWSPYPAGEWTHQFKGQLHAHYMAEHPGNVGSNCMGLNSIDGLPLAPNLAPEWLIRLYGLAGYDFVAVTEHYGNNQYEEDEHIWDQTPTRGDTGVWHIWDSMEDTPHPTDEIEGTARAGHLLGIGFDREEAGLPDWTEGAGAPDSNQMTPRTRVFRIQRMGNGMAVVAHPNVHKYRWTAADILGSGARGVEIYNAGSDIANILYPSWADSNDPLALSTWDDVLRSGGIVWGTAGDDFTVPWPQFDGGYVMVVCDTADPSKDDIMWALKQGSFYACEALSARYDAPRIEGYWYDREGETIHLLLGDDGYRVRFITAEGLNPTPPDVLPEGDYWDYQYTVASDDRYVRAEVKDGVGNISWTQPIFFDRPESDIATWFGASASGGIHATADPPLVVDVADAHLEVSTPQSEIEHVYGRTLGTFERPDISPPMGYVGECYEFLPEAALDGVNTLTIAYEDPHVQLFPESALAIYRYDEPEETWLALPSVVDDTADTVTSGIIELGIYALSGEIAEDTTPPTVAIGSPGDGSSQSGWITITATATDDSGVASVKFFLDGIALGYDGYGADGWTHEVDLSLYPPGSHVITAEAEDASGNSAQAYVTIATASPAATPGISFAAPEPEASYWIWEEVEVAGTWSDDDPLVLGLLAVDEAPLATFSDEGTGSWQTGLALGPGMEGERQLRVIGLDPYGNRSEASQPITLCFFSDVPQDQWAYLDIYKAAKADIVQGYGDGTYHPESPVTRDQMAVYISRALAGGDAYVPTGPATATFDDVPTDFWAFKYVEYAHDQGVVQGYDAHTYGPSVELDRGQMAVFIARSLAGGESAVPDGPATPHFPDVATDSWAYKHIEYIADPARAVTQGYPDGLYHPEYVCTRDQMAVFVARAFQLPL